MSLSNYFNDKETIFNQVSKTMLADIESTMVTKFVTKGELIIHSGMIPLESYLVSTGCVRQFQLTGKQEKTTAFFTEGQVILLKSIDKTSSYSFNLVAMEDTELIVCGTQHDQILFNKYPHLERISRESLEIELTKLQNEFALFITSSPEERYRNLLRVKPTLFNRVPLKYIASYLGMTPESLSRIRRRILISDKRIKMKKLA